MSQSGEGLLNGLKNVRWNIAAKTFGNNHATLIGLLVQWWIDSCPEMPQVLEAGPSHGHFKNGVGGGMCDAVFCDNSNAVGILEVEGTRYPHTFEKIGKFFNNPSAYPDLRFAVVVLYPTGPKGRGGERTMPKLEDVKVSSIEWVMVARWDSSALVLKTCSPSHLAIAFRLSA